ncbi:MAG: CPBP family intramembrane glutamic endopeptidase [Phycicoccus sp.]
MTTRLCIGRWPWLLGTYVVIVIPLAFLPGSLDNRSVEDVIFYLTMPGLEEELFYRGVLLLLLDRAFGTPWRLYGIRLGWGFVCSTVLFVLGHVVVVEASGRPQLFAPEPDRIAGFVMVCLALTVVRHATGPVWIAAMVHNMSNAVLSALPLPHLGRAGLILVGALTLARYVYRRTEQPSDTE